MMISLDAELLAAERLKRAAAVNGAMAELGLTTRRVPWGLARVAFYGEDRKLYEPQPDGDAMAIIVPVIEAGELIDLAAIDGHQHVGTRLGHGRALGLDEVARAAWHGSELCLVERPLDWLRDPVGRVYLFRLADAVKCLADVAEITCASIALAERLTAMLPPSWHKRVMLDD